MHAHAHAHAHTGCLESQRHSKRLHASQPLTRLCKMFHCILMRCRNLGLRGAPRPGLKQHACMQAATCCCRLPEARSDEQINELGMVTILLKVAVTHQRAEAGAVLRAAVALQALCLASRPGGCGGGETLPADKLHSLSLSMLRASATAQEAAQQLLLEQCDDQVSGMY